MSTETKEKKSKKTPAKDNQELIVRQSQMQRAIEMFTLIDYQPNVREVCRLSIILTNFIFDWDTAAAELKAFDEYILQQKQLLMQSQLETLLNDK